MIEVTIDDPAWARAAPQAESLAVAAAQATLDLEGRSAERHLAILLTSDTQMRTLNGRFRGRDEPTNVLAFPAPETSGVLGDVALAFGVCAREAAAQSKSLPHHLQHLTAHGVLHLLGYDHLTDSEADRMEARERAILAGLGIADPYAEDHGQPGQ